MAPGFEQVDWPVRYNHGTISSIDTANSKAREHLVFSLTPLMSIRCTSGVLLSAFCRPTGCFPVVSPGYLGNREEARCSSALIVGIR